jgi:hypothetical protein
MNCLSQGTMKRLFRTLYSNVWPAIVITTLVILIIIDDFFCKEIVGLIFNR